MKYLNAMKIAAWSAAVGAMLAVAPMAFADPTTGGSPFKHQYSDGSSLYRPGKICLPPEIVFKVGVEKYGEYPLLTWSFGGLVHFIMYNADKRTWTIFAKTEVKGKTVLCAISEGKNMRPALKSDFVSGLKS